MSKVIDMDSVQCECGKVIHPDNGHYDEDANWWCIPCYDDAVKELKTKFEDV